MDRHISLHASLSPLPLALPPSLSRPPSLSLSCSLSFPSPGLAEKTQLLKLSVPATFMLVALDEGPGPPIKYQYAELTKLYAVVSQLLRCCDVSTRMQSSINGMFHSVTALWLLSLLLSFLSLLFSLSVFHSFSNGSNLSLGFTVCHSLSLLFLYSYLHS